MTGQEIVGEFYHFASAHLSSVEYVPSPESLDLPPVQPRIKQEGAKKQTLPALIDGGATPWMECLIHFCRHIYAKSNSTTTAKSYYYRITKFLSVHPDPARVTGSDVETYVSQITDEGKPPTPGTRNHRLAILASYYKFAMAFIPTGETSPLYSGVPPTARLYYSKIDRIHRSFSTEELAKLFAVIPDTPMDARDRAYFLTAFLTTRRREELVVLKWGSIRRELVTDAHGQMRPGYTYEYHCKGNGPRVFKSELPALAYQAIVKWLKVSGRLATIQPDDYIFTEAANPYRAEVDTTKHIQGYTFWRRLKKYCKRAGISAERACIHSFRHTSIQQRLKAGEQPMEIMKVTHHRSLDAFYRYCAELQSEADPGETSLSNASHSWPSEQKGA